MLGMLLGRIAGQRKWDLDGWTRLALQLVRIVKSNIMFFVGVLEKLTLPPPPNVILYVSLSEIPSLEIIPLDH